MNLRNTKPIVLVCAADAGYVMPLAVMIKSVLVNISPPRDISLYVVDGGIHLKDKERLVKSWASEYLSVHWVQWQDSSISDLPLWGRMKINTYDRLKMTRFLPASLHKVIWLDCDMVVQGNIVDLWETDITDKAACAVQDMVVPYVSSRYGIAPHKELGIPSNAKYFNAGVMVVNLDWWRRNEVMDRACAYLKRYRETVTFWDQEGLNAILVDNWGELDPRWNQINSVAGRPFFKVEHLDEPTYQKVILDPWIVHFAGALKPWTYYNRNPSRALYFRYLDMTAWAGWRPKRTLSCIIRGVYESVLRDLLYPAEKWYVAFSRSSGIKKEDLNRKYNVWRGIR